MKFNDRLKALRTQASMTQKELSEKLNVSVVTIRNWELGSKSPSMSAIIALAKTLHVSTDYMLGVAPNQTMDYALLNGKEKSLLSNYRALDSHSRRIVDTVCLLERQRASDEVRKTTTVFVHNPKLKPNRYIPKYTTPSAAGFSVPLDGDDFEMILVDSNVPADADFAVTIQGDSMLPYVCDGETVYVKNTTSLVVGDVGIFSVNGAVYCKQYYIDELGNLTLVSANPEFRETNVFVNHESDANVRCFGKVLLDVSTPLPEYFVNQIKFGCV